MSTDIVESLNNNDTFFMQKRLFREFKKISDSDSLYINSIDINEKNYVIVNVVDYKYLSYNNYTFDLRGFPFSPPKITINGIKHTDFLHLNSPYFTTVLKKISGLRCLCCNSCLHCNNWSVIFPLYKVIEEIRTFRQYRRDIINILMADKIKNKYLISDIDLNTWLVEWNNTNNTNN